MLSTAVDKNARVTLQTTTNPSTGIIWSKRLGAGNWVQFGSTGAGVQSIVDKTPQRHYQHISYPGSGAMSFNWTGTEFAIFSKSRPDQAAFVETTEATSTTSNTLGTGSKTFTIEAGRAFVAGQTVKVFNNATRYFIGTVTSYSGTTLVINATSFSGSGTFASWTAAIRDSYIVEVHDGGYGRVNWQSQVGKLAWGRSGLSDIAHTTTLIPGTGGLEFFEDEFESFWFSVSLESVLTGLWYTDFAANFGDEIEYRAFIDSTTTETILVTPEVDREAAMQSIIDRLLAGNFFTNFPDNAAPYHSLAYNELMGVVAGMYYMSPDADLITAAETIYDAYIANSMPNGIIDDPASSLIGHLTIDGRTAYDYWFAYKVFNDSRFLDVADNIVNTFVNIWNKTANVWHTQYNTAMGNAPSNSWSAAAYSLALLHEEPASAWYHNSTVATLVTANADRALQGQPAGILYYIAGIDNTTEHIYGQFEWAHLHYISQKFSWQTSAIAGITDWIVNSFPYVSPFFFQSEFYWIQSQSFTLARVIAKYLRDGGTAADYKQIVDLLYSAAFDTIPTTVDNPGYALDGHAASSAALEPDVELPDHIIASPYILPLALANDVPKEVWAWAGAGEIPSVTAFTMPATSSSLTVPVNSFTGTDDVGVTGWIITESDTPPAFDDPGWEGSAPTSVLASDVGSITFYPWVKDADDNVSPEFGSPRTVVITLAGGSNVGAGLLRRVYGTQ